MKKLNHRTDRPQDEIPEDIWIQNVLDAYRKEHEELEFLRSFAHGLEEENVQLKKELEKHAENGEGQDVFERNKLLVEEVRRLKGLIEEAYPLRVMKLSTYKKVLQQQESYIRQLQKLLDANGIDYHEISKQPINDVNQIDVNAVRKSDDLKKSIELTDESISEKDI